MEKKCEHCQGTGTCRRPNAGSCDSCVKKAGLKGSTWSGNPTVQCGSCNGKGFHEIDVFPSAFGSARPKPPPIPRPPMPRLPMPRPLRLPKFTGF